MNYQRRMNPPDDQQYGSLEEPYYPDNGYVQPQPQPFDYSSPSSYLKQMEQYVETQLKTASPPTFYLIWFIFFVFILLFIYLLYSCLKNPKKTKKSLETIWERDAKPLLAKGLKRKTLAQRVGDAFVSDHHSMRSDDYEDFLRYKAKMMKYRQMEAQRKKQQNKFKHRKLPIYRFLSSDPATSEQYRRLTKDQISKLARKEKSCLIDLEGMEENEKSNARYTERHSPDETDTSPA